MSTICALAALAALVAVGTVGAAGSASFTDPAGDSGLAPDIVGFDVSNDDRGTLTLALKLANRPAGLTGDDAVLIGFVGKTDFLIITDAADQTYTLGRWSGNGFDFDVPQDTLETRDGLTYKINRSDLDNQSNFGLWVATLASWNGEGYGHRDVAPDRVGGMLTIWPYFMQFAPQLRAVKPAFAPAKPVAGKRFAVSGVRITLGTGQAVAPKSMTCSAKLAGKALPLAGRCAWQVPASAKGKRLVVELKVTYGGVTRAAGPFAFTVGG